MNKWVKSATCIAVSQGCFSVNADVSFTDKFGNHKKISNNLLVNYVNNERESFASLSDGTLTQFDHHNKSYFEITHKERCEFNKQVSDVYSVFSEAQQEMMNKHKALMKKPLEPIVTIEKGNDNIEIAGYKTTQYKVFVDGNLVEVSWQTQNEKLVSAWKSAYSNIDQLNCDSDETGNMSKKHWSDDEQYQSMKKKGVDLKNYSYASTDDGFEPLLEQISNGIINDKILDSVEIIDTVNVDFNSITASELEIPSNYKKITIEQAMSVQSGFDNAQAEENNDVALIETSPEALPESSDQEAEFPNESEDQSNQSSEQETLNKIRELAEDEGELGKFFFNAIEKALTSNDNDGNN